VVKVVKAAGPREGTGAAAGETKEREEEVEVEVVVESSLRVAR